MLAPKMTKGEMRAVFLTVVQRQPANLGMVTK